MEEFEIAAVGALATLGIGLIILGIISLLAIVGAIILLCLSVKEKGELKLKGIDEARIKKIGTLSVWSLVITIVSCSGCAFMVLPILALVFVNSNAKNAMQAGDIVEAVKKADIALIFVIISNAVVLGVSALSTITNIFTSILGLD